MLSLQTIHDWWLRNKIKIHNSIKVGFNIILSIIKLKQYVLIKSKLEKVGEK